MKSSEISGKALTWAVATAEGLNPRIVTLGTGAIDVVYSGNQMMPFENWLQGGPIIEREGIEIRVHCTHNNKITSWAAEKDWPMSVEIGACGPTPLIAAMRCHVISKLGDDVEIPDQLK